MWLIDWTKFEWHWSKYAAKALAQVFQGRSVCVAEQKFQITPIKMIEQATKKQTNEEFLKISQMTIQDMNDIMCTKK